MATEEDGGSQRLERSSSTETDSEPPQSGAELSCLLIMSAFACFLQSRLKSSLLLCVG